MAKPKLEVRVEDDMVIIEVGELEWKVVMSPLEAAIFASNLNTTVTEILDKKTKNL